MVLKIFDISAAFWRIMVASWNTKWRFYRTVSFQSDRNDTQYNLYVKRVRRRHRHDQEYHVT